MSRTAQKLLNLNTRLTNWNNAAAPNASTSFALPSHGQIQVAQVQGATWAWSRDFKLWQDLRCRENLHPGKLEAPPLPPTLSLLPPPPTPCQALLLKAEMLLQKGRYESVQTETARVLKLDDSNLRALLLRGLASIYQSDHEKALL